MPRPPTPGLGGVLFISWLCNVVIIVCYGMAPFSFYYLTISGVPRTTGVSSPLRTQVMTGAPYYIGWSQGTAVISVSAPSGPALKVT